jgi:mannose-6-phosphate isomerase-like protein (cupin superfamily)
MRLFKFRNAEEQDIGALLGIANMGIRTKWLINKEAIDNHNGQNTALKYFVIEPTHEYPVHSSECNETIYVLSGQAVFHNGTEKFEAGPGDALYIKAGEHYSINNPGGVPLVTINFCNYRI